MGTGYSTLRIDGTFTLDEYRVDVVELPSPVEGNAPVERYEGDIEPDEPVTPFVILNLHKDDQLIVSDITLYGGTDETNAYTTSDHELKIKATDYPSPTAKEWVYEYYDQWATISMRKHGVPELTVTVAVDKDSYDSRLYSHFKATIKIENTGDAYAKNLGLKIDTGGLTFKTGTLTHKYQTLEKNERYEEEITLSVPVSLDEKEFNITATATKYDLKEIEYIGNYSINQHTTERLDTMIFSHLRQRHWTETLLELTIDELTVDSVGSKWSTAYYLKLTTPNSGGHLLPVAHVKFTLGGKSYNIGSNKLTVIVRGPNITPQRRWTKVGPGETIRVTITAKNIGDLPSRTEIIDTLPTGAELVSGELNRTKFLLKNESLTYNYTIRLNAPGEVILPNVTARFTDVVYRGTVKRFISSEPTGITAIDPNALNQSTGDESSGAKNTGSEKSENIENGEVSGGNNGKEYVQPGFESILTVIGILLTYLWHRRLTDE